MQFICQTEFLPAILVSQFGPRRYFLSSIVKATFDLKANGPVRIAADQQFACGDVPYADDQDGTGAPRYASDFAPWKPSADLLLAGSCRLADGQTITREQVEFSVGKTTQRLEVFGEREWRGVLGVGKVSETKPLERVELRYENSFGGSGFAANPVGKGTTKLASSEGKKVWPLPNIEDPTNLILTSDHRPEPTGFGPLPITWPQRADKAGSYGRNWQSAQFPGPPADFDWSIYNASPAALQLPGYLRGDEVVKVTNLHPQAAVFATQLPGLRTRCFAQTTVDPRLHSADLPGKHAPRRETLLPRHLLEREDTYFYEIRMALDTLWVDTDAEQLVLTWRGMTPIATDDYAELQYLFVVTEPLLQQGTLNAYAEEFDRVREASETVEGAMAQLPGGLASKLPTLPDIDREMEKVRQQTAEVLAEGVDVATTNRQVAEAFGAQAPQLATLAGLSLSAQLAALDEFSTEMEETIDKLTATKQAAVREELLSVGVDPDNPPPETLAQVETEVQKFLQEHDVVAKLHESDAVFREMSMEAFRSGLNVPMLATNLGALLLGLRGTGADIDKLEADLGAPIGSPPLTREDVIESRAQGRSLAGVALVDVDLSRLDLHDTDFEGAVFVRVDLSNSNLSSANLTQSVLKEVNLTSAKLIKADLRKANLAGSNFDQAEFTGAVLDHALCGDAALTSAMFVQASAQEADFSGADLSGSRFDRARLRGADFSRCKLDRTVFRRADLRAAAFDQASGAETIFTASDLRQVRASRDCKLVGANFHQARMAESNWSHADLAGSDFTHAHLNGAFLIEATLAGCDFTAADLQDARLSKSKAREACFADAKLFRTLFDKADLSAANLRRAQAYQADFFEANLDSANFDGTIRST